MSKSKGFPDDTFTVAQTMEFIFHREENIVGREKLMLFTSIFFSSLSVFRCQLPCYNSEV